MISDELKNLFESEAVQKVTIYTDIPGEGTETRTITNTPVAEFKNGTANPIISLTAEIKEQQSGTPSIQVPAPIEGRSSAVINVNGTETTVSFGRSITRGEWDVIGGSITETHILATYDGSEYWISDGGYYCVPLDSSCRKSQSPVSSAFSQGAITVRGSDYSLLAMPLSLSSQMTLAQWKTYLSQKPLDVVLELVTPNEYTVDPLTLSTVSGENTITVSSGDILTLEYTAAKSRQITEDDIMMGSFSINRSIIEGSSLALGTCIASELNMTLINYDGRFNGVSWSGAELTVVLGVEGSDETLPMGVFYVDGTPKTRDSITLTALDGMIKFDKVMWVTGWGPNTTLKSLVELCCERCGVTLATDITNFPNSGWMPYAQMCQGYTYRQFLSYIIALMGKCAWMDENGQLRIGFAEKLGDFSTSAVVGIAIVGQAIVGNSSGSGFVTDTFGRDKRFNSDYEDTAITITGISYTRDDTVYTVGSADYVFDLSGNPILDYADYSVADSYTDVLANLIDLTGFKYTPISMTVVPCPHIFPMDWVSYPLGDNSNIYALVTDFTFVMNGANAIASRGESPEERAKASLTQSVNYVQNVVKATDDFVIASGEGWRAWKSGVLECWKRVTGTVDIQTAWGQLFYGEQSAVSYPSMGNYTFISVPTVHISGQAYNGGAWIVPGTPTTTGTGVLYWLRPTKSSVSITTNIYAVGRWK